MMKNDDFLPPPWIKFPEIRLGSSAWRMGHLEEYWYEWQDWYASKDEKQRALIRSQFPEPNGWEGFYVRTLEDAKTRVR